MVKDENKNLINDTEKEQDIYDPNLKISPKEKKIIEKGLSFGKAVEIINEEKVNDVNKSNNLNESESIERIKNKVEDINMGNFVTVIYGDFENQKVLRGKIVSIIDNGITLIDMDKTVDDPVVIQYNKIIDIFKSGRSKKNKKS